MLNNFIFAELQAAGAKPFEGMAAGSFVGMSGARATFLVDELPEYVKNTKKLIESTRSAGGELVGLPIDAYGHDPKSRAAGWIQDVELSADGEKILFTPNWTAEGVDLIESNTRRFFSPTVDLANRVILGGSLTNWPATRTATEIKLKPVELSTGSAGDLLQLIDGSLNEQIDRVYRAFINQFMDEFTGYPWPVEVYSDRLVVIAQDEKLYRVNYTETAGGGVEFDPVESWVQVRLSYIEAALQVVKQAIRTATGAFSKSKAGAQVQPGPAILEGAKMTQTPQTLNLEAILTTGTPEQVAELNALIEKQANTRVEQVLQVQRRAVEVQEFARRVTLGDAEHPRVLPGITEAELVKFMTSLTPEQSAELQAMLERVQTTAPADFGELGHSRTMPGTKPLPDWAAVELTKAIAGGMTAVDFFTHNAQELGEMSEYDLAKFTK